MPSQPSRQAADAPPPLPAPPWCIRPDAATLTAAAASAGWRLGAVCVPSARPQACRPSMRPLKRARARAQAGVVLRARRARVVPGVPPSRGQRHDRGRGVAAGRRLLRPGHHGHALHRAGVCVRVRVGGCGGWCGGGSATRPHPPTPHSSGNGPPSHPASHPTPRLCRWRRPDARPLGMPHWVFAGLLGPRQEAGAAEALPLGQLAHLLLQVHQVAGALLRPV
jgi:hypothetical protein